MCESLRETEQSFVLDGKTTSILFPSKWFVTLLKSELALVVWLFLAPCLPLGREGTGQKVAVTDDKVGVSYGSIEEEATESFEEIWASVLNSWYFKLTASSPSHSMVTQSSSLLFLVGMLSAGIRIPYEALSSILPKFLLCHPGWSHARVFLQAKWCHLDYTSAASHCVCTSAVD